MFEDCTLEQKQLAIQETLGKSLFFEDFLNWIKAKHPDRLGLDDWSLEELNNLTVMYLDASAVSERSKDNRNLPDEPKRMSMIDSTVGQPIQKTEETNKKDPYGKPNQRLSYCLSLPIEELPEIKITRIRVNKVEKEKKGLFGTRKIFWIETQEPNWCVPRRLSDFRWLGERLSREFPNLKVII